MSRRKNRANDVYVWVFIRVFGYLGFYYEWVSVCVKKAGDGRP